MCVFFFFLTYLGFGWWSFFKNWHHVGLLNLFLFNVVTLTIMPSIRMLSEVGKRKSDSPTEPSEEVWQCGRLDSRFLASRTVKECISAALSPQEK